MWIPKKSELVYQKQSPYQKIALFKDGNHYWMSLNDVMQFHTKECYTSHRYMCQIPLRMVKNPRKVLIIGGGDGFAAREMLKDSRVQEIINVELDGDLVDLTKQHPIMQMLTEDAFNHPKVTVIKGDGIKFLLEANTKFDIIIDDCEYEYTGQPGGREEARYDSYTRCLVNKLNPGGVACLMEPLVRVKPFKAKTLGRKLMQLNKFFIDVFHGGKILTRQEAAAATQTGNLQDKLLKKFMASDEYDYWKARAPYLKVAIYMNDTIGLGPEAYVYMANHPI